MSWPTLIRKLFGQQPTKRRFSSRPSARVIRPRLEPFEDRLLPSVYTVVDLGDAGIGSGLEGDLRYAITQANANADNFNRVVFQPGLTGTIHLTQGPLSITKELEIDGPGQDLLTVSGDGQSGVLFVTQSALHVNTVFVSDLTIADGTGFTFAGKVFGGGIYTTSADLTLTRVTVSGNSIPQAPEGGGGGIYKASGTLTLVSSTVADNQVGSGGNGTYSWGGGIYNEGTLTVLGSTISGNSVSVPGQSSGGGVYSALGSTVTISHSAVLNNTAVNGGGIFNGQLIVDHSAISGNQGGGIWSYALVQLSDSTVADNTGQSGILALDFQIERSTISGNSGGGVAQLGSPSSGVIENSTISGNTGTGGILVGSSYGGLGNFLTLDHCTVVNNHGRSGGGILVGTYGSYHGYLIISQTVVAGNDSADPSAGPDVDGPVEVSGGNNFIGDGDFSSGWTDGDRVGTTGAPLDPLLGPLQDNGGPTLTSAPLPGSPLLLDGPGDDSPDQRGSLRLTNAPGAVAYNPATAFRVSAPSAVVAGQPFALAVTAIDPWGNTASTYSGTVHFSSTDPDAQLPDDYTFGTADGGAHTSDAALQTAGPQAILVQDTSAASLAAALIVVVEDGPALQPSGWGSFDRHPAAPSRSIASIASLALLTPGRQFFQAVDTAPSSVASGSATADVTSGPAPGDVLAGLMAAGLEGPHLVRTHD
jgi:hypothetical protein